MEVIQIKAANLGCFGVCCARHAECARYHAIDNAPHDQVRIATCEHGPQGSLFVKVEKQ